MENSEKQKSSTSRIYYIVPLCGAIGGLVLWISRGGNYLCYRETLIFIKNTAIKALFFDILIGAVAAVIALLFLKPFFYKKKSEDKSEKKPDFMKIAALSLLSGFMGISLITVSKNTALKMLSKKVANIELNLESIRKIAQANDAIRRGVNRFNSGNKYLKQLEESSASSSKESRQIFDKALFHYKISLARYRRAKGEDKENKLIYIQEAKAYHQCSRLYKQTLKIPGFFKDSNEQMGFLRMKHLYREKAIFTLNVLTKLNKNYGRAYYNRACYKFQFDYDVQDIAKDLCKAFSLNSMYREIYKLDQDFTSKPEKFELIKMLVENSSQ